MATVTINRETVTPPVKSVTLELSPREASSLRRLISANVDGHSIANFVTNHPMRIEAPLQDPYTVTDDICQIQVALRSVPVVG